MEPLSRCRSAVGDASQPLRLAASTGHAGLYSQQRRDQRLRSSRGVDRVIRADGSQTRSIVRLVRWSLTGLAFPFFVAALFAASVLPYRYWDSLAFGSWSRLIAQTGDVITPHLFANNLNRPLFYVTQGLVWHWFGY